MTNDLPAAAKRLQRYKAGDETAYPDDREYFDEHGCTLLESDETKLADFAAAELDDTPLTYQTYGELCDGYGIMARSWSGGAVQFAGLGCEYYVCRTVGELRTAARLAGIELKEPTQ